MRWNVETFECFSVCSESSIFVGLGVLMQTDERIACLRKRVLARKDSAAVARALANPVVVARSLRASEACDSWTIQRGRLTRDRLLAVCFAIDDLELLAGRLDLTDEPSPEEVEAAFRHSRI